MKKRKRDYAREIIDEKLIFLLITCGYLAYEYFN